MVFKTQISMGFNRTTTTIPLELGHFVNCVQQQNNRFRNIFDTDVYMVNSAKAT